MERKEVKKNASCEDSKGISVSVVGSCLLICFWIYLWFSHSSRFYYPTLLKKPPATTIKDTWTKSRGRVEVGEGGVFSWGGVEGWGEKAHNCN